MVRNLRRPPNPETLKELEERYAAEAPDVLRSNFANSLEAAFLPEEVEAQLEPAGLSCLKIKTIEDRYLEMRGQLPEASPR